MSSVMLTTGNTRQIMHLQQNNPIYTSRLLTSAMGDVTIGWTDDQAEVMTALIQKKMDEGYSFFILDTEQREIRLRDIKDLERTKSVIIGDKEAESLILQGKIGIVEVVGLVEDEDIPTTTRAKTAAIAAKSNTVQVPPKRGG